MKRIWGWVSELFSSAPRVRQAAAPRALVAVETPSASWSLTDVNELRWA